MVPFITTRNKNAMCIIMTGGVLLLMGQSDRSVAQQKDPPVGGEREQGPSTANGQGIPLQHWKERALRVAYADMVMHYAFSRSMSYWRFGWQFDPGWSHEIHGDLKNPIEGSGTTNILIEGDCLAKIHTPSRAVIHIQGDLNADIQCDGATEVIIGGSIAPGRSIVCAQSGDIFVGGDTRGTIESQHLHCWIDGDMAGKLTIGEDASVHVVHDLTGTLEVNDRSRLAMVVDGFMQSEKLRSIADSGGHMEAAIGASDCDPWLYPDPREPNLGERFKGFWVVQHRRGETAHEP